MKYIIERMYDAVGIDGKSFIGISRVEENAGFSITVPYGMNLPDIIERTDKGSFSLLKRYIKTVHKALNSEHVKAMLENHGSDINNPISGINVIVDYISNGIYKEYEIEYKKQHSGKIDFKRTIQSTKPQIIDGDCFYDELITKHRTTKDDDIVAIAQGNVINHFIENGGEILFGSKLLVPVKRIKLDKKLVTRLRMELAHSFNSRKQNIIRWIINYIDGIRINNKSKGKWNYAIIGSTYWEEVVDRVLSNQVVRNKTIYGKKYYFTSVVGGGKVSSNNPTQHDTIFENEKVVMIIDAKLYKNSNALLSESVLGKQFGYYREAKIKNPHKTIVNILLLPALYEVGESAGFCDNIILDPHNEEIEKDGNKIIFVYKADVKNMINAYFYGKKGYGDFLEEFKSFISRSDVASFLSKRNAKFIV